MTPEEEGVLLLCSTLGQTKCWPLSVMQLIDLRTRVSGMASRPEGELSVEFLMGLGYTLDLAERMFLLLDRRERLARYLEAARRAGVRCVTCFSPDYPAQAVEKLRDRLPPVLFCAGDLSLLWTRCAGLAGSRRLGQVGQSFARRVGTRCAEEGITLCSGGAVGADTVGTESCRRAGGAAISFVADSLEARVRCGVRRGELLVSEDAFERGFSSRRAFSRNRLIHLMGERTFIAQTDCRTGGTWQGAEANLHNRWSELMVCADGSRGASALIAEGATAVPPEGPDRIYPQPVDKL